MLNKGKKICRFGSWDGGAKEVTENTENIQINIFKYLIYFVPSLCVFWGKNIGTRYFGGRNEG
jgi:hypothetical protein